ncbi:Transcriptional regulatory protein ZraR [compost metagenome]
MKVLLISDDRAYSSYLKRNLNAEQIETEETFALQNAVTLIKKHHYDAVVCCVPILNTRCPHEILATLKEAAPGTGVIFITENVQIYKAIELVRQGLFTCLNRPVFIEELIANLAQLKCLQKEKASVWQKQHSAEPLHTRAQTNIKKYVAGISMRATRMYEQIDLVAPTSFSVIIYGETGTGKESVAHRLAQTYDRKAPYIAVDCGCLSKELALSELFGHEKGSFTGAHSAKAGAFELAHKGTIFLDEIANLDYDVQSYLLRALQERKIRRVGGTEDIPVEVRVIAASNEDLALAVKAGKFREDLFHRLNEFEIAIPPLRERKEDLNIFIEHFMQETNIELHKIVMGIDAETEQLLRQYEWPGNIRELKNVIRRACLLTDDGCLITRQVLPREILYPISALAGDDYGLQTTESHTKKATRRIGIKEIEEALKCANYNKSKAASLLRIDRKTLYNKLKSFSLVGST